MNTNRIDKTRVPRWPLPVALAFALGVTLLVLAQTPNAPSQEPHGPPPGDAGLPPPGGPGLDGPPPFGPGGFGAPGVMAETKLVKQFDQNGDQRLDASERKAARSFIVQQRSRRGPGFGGPGGPRGGMRGPGGDATPPQPGPKLSPADVTSHANTPIYDPQTVRTFFLEFENADWEKELSDFHNTDVEVPARLTVDGQSYPDFGDRPMFGDRSEGRPDGPPGRMGGPGGGFREGGVELDPLVAANDVTKPLLSKLLAVPTLRARYLGYVRDIAEKWLDWNRLGPLVQRYQTLIAADVKADTRKLYSTEAFLAGIADDSSTSGGFSAPGRGQRMSLKRFAEQRRAYLLSYSEGKRASSP